MRKPDTSKPDPTKEEIANEIADAVLEEMVAKGLVEISPDGTKIRLLKDEEATKQALGIDE